jgi:sulfate permease, SulP family
VMLLAFVLLLAPLVSYLALPTLAAVLMTVAWRLVDHHEIVRFLRTAPRDDAMICITTLLLTVFVDLTVAISAGVVGSALLFMHRMAELPGSHEPPHDPAKAIAGVRQLVFRGPLFFGQSARVADALRDVGEHRVLLLDMGEVPLIDATAINVLVDLAADCKKTGCRLVISGLQHQPRQALHRTSFLRDNRVVLAPTVEAGLERARVLASTPRANGEPTGGR